MRSSIIQFRKPLAALSILLGICIQSALASEIVVNPANQEPIDQERIKLMLTGKERFWKSGAEVVIAIVKTDENLDETLLRYSGMTELKFKNHWQRIAFSGRGKMPRTFSDIADLESFVLQHPGAIGILPDDRQLASLRRGLGSDR